MRRIQLLLLAGSVGGCTGFGGPKTQSEWSVLADVDAAECALWPMRDRDLQLNEVALTQGGKTRGFGVSGLRRDAAPMHYYAPFDGDVELDKEDYVDLNLGRGAILLGGAVAGGKELAFVGRVVGDKTTLEVRSVRDNVVRYKGPLADTIIEDGGVDVAASGAWLTVRDQDGAQRLAYVDLSKPDKIESRVIPAATRTETLRVLPRPGKADGVLALWREGETGQPFKARWVGMDGKVGEVVSLDFTVTSQVESWTAVGYGGGYYLAVVDGDSLIGQSELKIAHINWSDGSAQVRWTKASPLTDEHVTEPVFAVTERGLEALVLKWIDEESTIARYMVAGGTVGKPKYSGIFPKGSRIIEAFTSADGDDLYVVTRNRGESGWVFRICEM